VAIRYAPGQLREATGLSKDTWHYWRKEIPWLNSSSGSPRACFGPGELLAVAVLKQLHSLGLPISRLVEIADGLRVHCCSSSWPQLERTSAVVELRAGKVTYLSALPVASEQALLVLPLGPLIASLREHLFEEAPIPQRTLVFPPVALRRG
jgi:hypothetical protein